MRCFLPLALVVLLLSSAPVFARANGGGGKGAGGVVQLILLPVLLACHGLAKHRIRVRAERCEKFLQNVAELEPEWAADNLREVASGHFMAVQQAWCAGDVPKVGSYLTGSVQREFLGELERMLAQGQRNVIEGLRVTQVQIVGVHNHAEDSRDSFTVLIDAECLDYVLDAKGKVILVHGQKASKIPTTAKSFQEFWTFVRSETGWLASEVTEWNQFTVQKAKGQLVDERRVA